MSSSKERTVYILTVIFSVIYLFAAHRTAVAHLGDLTGEDAAQFLKAKVISITERSENDIGIEGLENSTEINIEFEAKITDGQRKGETVTAYQNLSPLIPIDYKEVEKNDRVLLIDTEIYGFTGEAQHEWYFAEYIRIDKIILLGVLFFICLIIFGRKKGLSTVLSLVFTCVAVFAAFIPAILSGHNIYLWSIMTCAFIILMTLLLVNGANEMSLSAGLGCLGGVLLSGLLTSVMGSIIKLTGYMDEHSIYLMYLNEDRPIDLRAIIFGAIIVGAVGAIMDVAVNIAASLHEIYVKVPSSTPVSLFRSGLTIGRDIMGTMSNTLVLAYIGSSLCSVLLIVAYNGASLDYLFNRETIIVELLQALVGSFGMLLTIPLTAFFSGVLYPKRRIRGRTTES